MSNPSVSAVKLKDADFDPLNPLMSFLLDYDSDVVRDVLYRTGVPANFELNERERFSHRTRSSAYDQRFRRAYNELDEGAGPELNHRRSRRREERRHGDDPRDGRLRSQ